MRYKVTIFTSSIQDRYYCEHAAFHRLENTGPVCEAQVYICICIYNKCNRDASFTKTLMKNIQKISILYHNDHLLLHYGGHRPPQGQEDPSLTHDK